MSTLEHWLDAAAGSSLATRLGMSITRQRLRILAYHGVSNPARFAEQMEILSRHFNPVGVEELLTALEDRSDLPERAVWITFDDGDPSVIDVALPVLRRLELPSTMFICPGLVDTSLPFWWQLAEAFLSTNLARPPSLATGDEPEVLRRLKSMPDTDRRALLDEMTAGMTAAGLQTERRQITTEELQRYINAGGTLGNHTWDHPCLDRCTPEEQRRQVADADQWLCERFSFPTFVFAYPNGNWSSETETTLSDLDYEAAVTFDHRLTDVRFQPRFQLSRLRVNSELTLDRYRAIISGIHPIVHRTRTVSGRMTSFKRR